MWSRLIVHLSMQAMQAVQVPVYDFTLHQRAQETRRVEPADVVIIEGILVLHMESVRSLLNMKIFVDTDDDVRLARRWVPTSVLPCDCAAEGYSHTCSGTSAHAIETCIILYSVQGAGAQTCSSVKVNVVPCSIQRDVAIRGRDVASVIEQYTQQVKPAFDQYVAPSRKHADVIIPWAR